MFSAPSLTLKSIMMTLLYWAVIQTVGFIFFQVKAFWFGWRSIDIRPIDFALLAHFASLAEHLTHSNKQWQIAMFLVTSPIVIKVPTRGLLAVETMHAIVQWLANLNIKRNATSMFVNKKHRYKGTAYISVFAKACPYLPVLITIVQNSWR